MLHNTKKLNALKKKIKDFGPAPYDNKNTALIRLANSWEMSSNNGYEVLIVEGLNKLDDNTIVFFLEAAEEQGFKRIVINLRNITSDALWRILYFPEVLCSNICGVFYEAVDTEKKFGYDIQPGYEITF